MNLMTLQSNSFSRFSFLGAKKSEHFLSSRLGGHGTSIKYTKYIVIGTCFKMHCDIS